MNAQLKILETISTSSVSEALDRLAIRGVCRGITALAPHYRMCGRAHTVRIVAQSSVVRPHDEYMDDLQPGEVCALDAQGILDGGSWGDLRSLVASRRGVAGTVVDGAVRDAMACLESRYPIFTRATTMLPGGGRLRIEAKQTGIMIGGVYVSPGDVLFGDGNGLLAIPRTREEEVIALAAAIEAGEANVRRAILDNMPLAEARKQFAHKGTRVGQ